MKLTLIIILSAILQVHGVGYAQKVSISQNDITLRQVFKEINKQTGYKFLYSTEMLKNSKPVSVHFKNAPLSDILEKCFEEQALTFKIIDKTIIVKQKEQPAITNKPAPPSLQIAVKGKVTDEKGAPLPGVSVKVEGTSIGVSTDLNGNFSIALPDNRHRLLFSFIGFASQTVTISGQTNIHVVLKEEMTSLNEVVVVGYSSQKKKDLTGAVSIVDVEEMTKQPSPSISNLLQGQASGVTILGSGQPGEAPQIRIRGLNTFGNNTPLFVIDGVPTQNVSDINPNDIASMQVLKDAGSASIYGSRASNGVIIVTTKSGTGKVKIQYDAYYGTQRPKSGNVWDILSPQEMANLKRLAQTNSGKTVFDDDLYGDGPTYVLPDYILPEGASEGDPGTNPALYNVNPNFTEQAEYDAFNRITKANKTGTDWYHEIFNPAPLTSHNLAVSGGTEQGSYLFSMNYFNQEGTLLETYFKRYSVRANTSYKVGKNIRIGENLEYSIVNNPQIAGLTGDNAIGHAFREQPIIPVRDIMGNYAGSYGGNLGDAYNPVAMLERTRNNKTQNNRLFGSVYAEADILKMFTLRTVFGGESYSGNSRSFTFPQYENAENSTSNSYNEDSNNGYNFTWTNTLSFNKDFGKHHLKVLAGTEFYKNRYNTMGGSRKGYFSFDPNYTTLSSGSPDGIFNYSAREADALFSLIGRADYNYKGKYLLGATIRRDGSSKFLENVYGWFPSVSAGWRISQEPFLKDITWISDLKIRGGWGIMGNQLNVTGDNSFSTYSSAVGQSFYPINGGNSVVTGFYQNQFGNPVAKWEKDINSNFGFDASLFHGKLEITADYYRKDIRDLLFNPEMIATQGTAIPPYINIAQMKNDGFDISLTGNTNITPALKLNATATVTTYRNKIMQVSSSANYYDEDGRRFDGSNIIRNEVGHSIAEFFGYKVAGFWNTQDEIEQANARAKEASGDSMAEYQTDIGLGRFKYEDVNGDGRITALDRTFLGNANPDFSYGLNLGLTFKDFDLSMFFYGVQGNKIWNQVKWWTDFYPSFNGAKSYTALYDSWTPQNHNASAPIQEETNSFSTNAVPNSYFVESGSYLRLKNAQIGYSLPVKTLQRFGVSRLRVYLSAANLFTVTKYSGVDPEIGTSSETDSQTAYGVDDGSYPSQRTFLLGLNLTF
ncbi:TonB-dependent receptor [Arcticibacter tournemirensis]|nr:TonB-dependent receptor [Arcticibacter tournemirensis]